MEKNLQPYQADLIQSLLDIKSKTSLVLREVGKIQPGQAIRSPILFNYPDREKFEIKYMQLLRDSELILGTNTKAIDIISLRFLEHWKYEHILVLLKFIDELTKGVFKKVHKNVLDLPTLNTFFIEFKGPYIEALEIENRAKDKDTKNEIDYEAYKNRMKNEKGAKYQQAKKFSDYLESRGKKGLLSGRGNIRTIPIVPAPDPAANQGIKDSTFKDPNK